MAGPSPAITTVDGMCYPYSPIERNGRIARRLNCSWCLTAEIRVSCRQPSRGRRRRHDLRQQLLALGLRSIARHGRGEAFENAVFERGDDGVMNVALPA